MKITIVAGARPNFMKIAPIIHAIKKKQQRGFDINHRLVHPGQHYDKNLKAVFTYSGGITKEASVLNVPCITFRDTTERPETCKLGTNMLAGNDLKKINAAFNLLDSDSWKKGQSIPKWDGKAALRIVDHILKLYGKE